MKIIILFVIILTEMYIKVRVQKGDKLKARRRIAALF